MSQVELLGSMMDAGVQIFDHCDVQLEDFFGYVDGAGSESDAHEIAEDVVELFPGICDSDQATEFEVALTNFKTCSSFDMELIVETIIDAEIGAFLECVVSLAPMADEFLDIMDVGDPDTLAKLELPDLCVDSFLGQNPFGDMFRSWFLHPDQILPCFDELSKNIPPCTLQRWPIPIIGPLLRRATCIVGNSRLLLEKVTFEMLNSMQRCIPSNISTAECSEVKMNCAMNEGFESLMFPKPLGSIPLSDLTRRVAREKGMADAVEKYDNFILKCDPTPWKGWSYSSGNYESLAVAGSSASPDTTTNDKASFLTGMLCGVVVSAVIAAVMILVFRRRHYHQLNAKSVGDGSHLPELQLDDNAYSDDDPNTSSEDDKSPISEAELT